MRLHLCDTSNTDKPNPGWLHKKPNILWQEDSSETGTTYDSHIQKPTEDDKLQPLTNVTSK